MNEEPLLPMEGLPLAEVRPPKWRECTGEYFRKHNPDIAQAMIELWKGPKGDYSDGASIRSIADQTGAAINTVRAVLESAGVLDVDTMRKGIRKNLTFSQLLHSERLADPDTVEQIKPDNLAVSAKIAGEASAQAGGEASSIHEIRVTTPASDAMAKLMAEIAAGMGRDAGNVSAMRDVTPPTADEAPKALEIGAHVLASDCQADGQKVDLPSETQSND